MRPRSNLIRRMMNRTVMGVSLLTSLAGILILAWILYEVISRGAGAFNWSFFTKLPAPLGETGGGVANAILGGWKVNISENTLSGQPVSITHGGSPNRYLTASRVNPSSAKPF